MLSKGRRILKSADFRRVYRRGKKVSGKRIKLYFYYNQLKITRFGYSISKKVGKAFRRNLLKRRLREICRKNIYAFKTGLDIVMVARESAAHIGYGELEQEVLKLGRTGKILTKGESSGNK